MNTRAIETFEFIGKTTDLTKQFLSELFNRPFYFDLLIIQLQNIGLKSIPIVIVVSGSVGMVMALQFGIGLEKFGGTLYIPKLVSVSIVRELAPAFASLLFAARVGAGITAEVASMVVTQQVDAMRALGTSPIKKIVVPRVLACLIALPLLTVMGNIIGIVGAMMVSTLDLGLDVGYYIYKVRTSVLLRDYFSGFGKTFFFALFVAIPACYFGLNTNRGTKGVGHATTSAVVISSILILVGDYFLTKLFWILETWK